MTTETKRGEERADFILYFKDMESGFLAHLQRQQTIARQASMQSRALALRALECMYEKGEEAMTPLFNWYLSPQRRFEEPEEPVMEIIREVMGESAPQPNVLKRIFGLRHQSALNEEGVLKEIADALESFVNPRNISRQEFLALEKRRAALAR